MKIKMKKRVISAFVAGVSAAMFGVLYPEYVLLPGTYEYINIVREDSESGNSFITEKKGMSKKDCQGSTFVQNEIWQEDISKLLSANPDEIQISSALMQFFDR